MEAPTLSSSGWGFSIGYIPRIDTFSVIDGNIKLSLYISIYSYKNETYADICHISMIQSKTVWYNKVVLQRFSAAGFILHPAFA
jgi:hypothetical protein